MVFGQYFPIGKETSRNSDFITSHKQDFFCGDEDRSFVLLCAGPKRQKNEKEE
jgi:hypothetical protein